MLYYINCVDICVYVYLFVYRMCVEHENVCVNGKVVRCRPVQFLSSLKSLQLLIPLQTKWESMQYPEPAQRNWPGLQAANTTKSSLETTLHISGTPSSEAVPLPPSSLWISSQNYLSNSFFFSYNFQYMQIKFSFAKKISNKCFTVSFRLKKKKNS